MQLERATELPSDEGSQDNSTCAADSKHALRFVKECFHRPQPKQRGARLYTLRLLTCTKESVAVLPVYERDVPLFWLYVVIHTTNCKCTQSIN
jgi:hypothetical protein